MKWDWSGWLMIAAPDLIVALAVGVLSATIGGALAVLWSTRQKVRELDLEAARDFHNHYGAFFSIWKSWNWYWRQGKSDPVIHRELFERATAAEGGIESILSRVAAYRRLSMQMVEDLACFRQAFQSLRQAIRDHRLLDWGSSDVIEYRRFKELSGRVSEIIHGRPWVWTSVARRGVWKEITANKWEALWREPNKRLQATRPKQRAPEA